jgi:heptosyltransferase-1
LVTKILIVKLSSLGDVIHTLPVVRDLARAFPGAQIDWVVEAGFAEIIKRTQGVNKVIHCHLRRWSKKPFNVQTQLEWKTFKKELQLEAYDAVIDLQGLSKSALVSRVAKLSSTGKRYAMGNRTNGSSYEVLTRWLADVAIQLPLDLHAVSRGRVVCAKALQYQAADNAKVHFKLNPINLQGGLSPVVLARHVMLVHGSSRQDKCWAQNKWLELGLLLAEQGLGCLWVHGNEAEQKASEAMAMALHLKLIENKMAITDDLKPLVLPRLGLGPLADHMARCAGVIGVDSGLSHLAVALNLPHVQIYNFNTDWRTGPIHNSGQCSVMDTNSPSVEKVWQAWLQVQSGWANTSDDFAHKSILPTF